ncbi:MAG: DUF1015 family protein [Myxococcota bacterium]
MTVVRAFRAVRYDTDRVDLSRVIVPPYDVIAADERASFYDRDRHNAIRLELVKDVADEAGTDYSEVAETLSGWLDDGVLRRDDGPALYVMRQRYTAPDGRTLERTGFFAELGLENYEDRIVRPHERTLAGPKADRLKILRATRANLSSVFMLYEDREQAIASVLASAFEGEGVQSAKDPAGVEYTLARLDDPEAVSRVAGFLADRPVVIADGHHRYETALAYRDQMRESQPDAGPEAPFESTLAYFANAYAPGSLLLPIHRVIVDAPSPEESVWRERLPGWQTKSVPLPGVDALPDLLAEHLEPLSGRPSFAADDGGGTLRIFWRDESLGDELMVRIAERDVIGQVFDIEPEAIRQGAVAFPKSALRAARDVREGQGSVALYLNPMTPDDVFATTGRGEVMPQKSTFFYPKIPTGLVFRVHDRPGDTGS